MNKIKIPKKGDLAIVKREALDHMFRPGELVQFIKIDKEVETLFLFKNKNGMKQLLEESDIKWETK